MNKKYQRADNIDIVARKIAGETFLVPVKSRMADLQTLFVLNGIGEFIWENMAEAVTSDALIELITKKFAVEKDIAEKDLLEFMTSLKKEGLIL